MSYAGPISPFSYLLGDPRLLRISLSAVSSWRIRPEPFKLQLEGGKHSPRWPALNLEKQGKDQTNTLAVYHWWIRTTSNLYSFIKEDESRSKYYGRVHLFFDYKMYANQVQPSGSWKSARVVISVIKWKGGGNRAPHACKRGPSSCHQAHLEQEALAMPKGQVEDKPCSNLSLFKREQKNLFILLLKVQ